MDSLSDSLSLENIEDLDGSILETEPPEEEESSPKVNKYNSLNIKT